MPITSPNPVPSLRLRDIYPESTEADLYAFLREHKLTPVAIRVPQKGDCFVPYRFGQNEYQMNPWIHPGTALITKPRLIVRRSGAY